MKTYFTVEEMRCKDKARTPYPARYVDDGTWYKLRSTADTFRDACGFAMPVLSGYRTPEHNLKVEGALHSQHVLGAAMDLRIPPHLMKEAYATLMRLYREGKLPHLGGVGRYLTFIHIDVRPRKANGSLYRWKGKAVKD